MLLLWSFFFRHGIYSIFNNSLDGSSFPCKVVNLTLRVITCPDELRYLSDKGFNFSEYTRTIPSGQTLFLAFVGKEVVHGTRIFLGKTGVHRHFCSSMDDSTTAYIGGIQTIPKFRRQGINAFVHSKIHSYLRDKGMLRAITVVRKDNIAEENCQLKLGSYLSGEGHSLVLLSLFKFWWVKSKS